MKRTRALHAMGWLAVALVSVSTTMTMATATDLGGAAADGPPAGAKAAADQLRGAWRPEAVTEGGRKLAGADLEVYAGMTLTIQDGKTTLKTADGTALSTCELKLDAGRAPRTFDAREVEGPGAGRTYQGIWEIEGDTLKWCFSLKDRPRNFDIQEDENFFLLVLKRQKSQ